MKKYLFLFLGLLVVTGIMAQTNKVETTKEGTKTQLTKDANPVQSSTNDNITPITTEELNQLTELIKSKKAENAKLAMAKRSIKNKHLLSSQVKDIAFLFKYADTRFTFTKYAYQYAIDKKNYNSEVDSCFYASSPPGSSRAYPAQKNKRNELHDNWERTNNANVVYTNWVYTSYGTDNNMVINR